MQIVSSAYKSSIVVSADKIIDFLDYANLQIEIDQSYGFVEDFGQKTFDSLKKNALKLLSGKTSELFSIKDEQEKQYNSFYLTLHNHLNNTKASIYISYNQKVSSINPLRVSVMAVVNFLEDKGISDNYMHFFIPQHKIKNYPFIHFNILGYKDEANFVDELMSTHKDSKILSYFNLNCELEEKDSKPKRPKI